MVPFVISKSVFLCISPKDWTIIKDVLLLLSLCAAHGQGLRGSETTANVKGRIIYVFHFRNLALILISAKFFALLARKCRAPQVVGEIIAGLVIGPVC